MPSEVLVADLLPRAMFILEAIASPAFRVKGGVGHGAKHFPPINIGPPDCSETKCLIHKMSCDFDYAFICFTYDKCIILMDLFLGKIP